ncbi:homoserine dehydrogenase [Croceimicrobium hydrocarbonivorans]|uniref:Homoserine dehydrogenase n=1 Tax=Croceimicrobium hydrocarbonivorans TaxID=2761580 RepID=A0A7H0VJ77_9FLAO|nr:homoserine dehydrogenase [Croceimicrobium hydrocarbonivorans]QNR25775.1 homoserine dehydrogenase [Croceimicrobium hydrocarbonivorans]
MKDLPICIGLAGLGCVGQGLYDVVQKHYRDRIDIRRIAVKDPEKERKVPSHLLSTNFETLLSDPEIKVIVECIDDPDAAYELCIQAFKRGKDVISANKQMIAQNLDLLIFHQRNSGQSLLYEAAVAASIPIIRLLESHFEEEEILSIEAILNGTSNYILSKIQLEGLSFKEALAEAKAKGFAESDPSNDLEGKDAAAKAVILAAHAFGKQYRLNQVERTSIDESSSQALEPGLSHKCLALLDAQSLQIKLSAVAPDSEFNRINYERNAVQVRSAIGGLHFYSGSGAGADATASALLSDLFQWQRGFRYRYSKLKKAPLEAVV